MTRLAPFSKMPRESCADREAKVLEICAGRRVLHLACAAWPATEQWCADGSLLHLRLAEVAGELAGFDQSPEALAILGRYDAGTLFPVDLLDARAVAEAWSRLPFLPEVIFAGEVLEHLDAPGVLLRNVAAQMGDESRLWVTVPNAFSLRSAFHAFRGSEKVAPDHVAYYSPATLRELLERSAFSVDELLWYRRSAVGRGVEGVVGRLADPILSLQPQWSEGLIACCRRNPRATDR